MGCGVLSLVGTFGALPPNAAHCSTNETELTGTSVVCRGLGSDDSESHFRLFKVSARWW